MGGELFLDAFLDQKDYNQIRKNLEFNEDYRKGKDNKILLPGDSGYENIFPLGPLKMEVRIFDSQGNRVHLDEAGH